ncbi:MAG: hypothetical protein GX206_13225 [Clostridiales bacterium]|nr:hypothetical protein [Clostridiales bacterium]
MNFLMSLFSGEFNFTVPISYIVAGTLAAVFIFTVRYVLYTKRKKAFANQTINLGKKQQQDNIQLVNEETGQALQENMI